MGGVGGGFPYSEEKVLSAGPRRPPTPPPVAFAPNGFLPLPPSPVCFSPGAV